MEAIINYQGVKLIIKFRVEGQYYPATLETPAEEPEVQILEILAGDVDIQPLLLNSQEEAIYNLLLDKL